MNPGTVSKILWHFTGGPVWDKENNKQGKKLKPNSEAYTKLNSIISCQTVKVGSYHEVFRAENIEKIFLDYNVKTGAQIIGSKIKESEIVNTRNVCCLADIPLQHLEHHGLRYGKCAIGFYRDAAIRQGFNPVLYEVVSKASNNSFYKLYNLCEFLDEYINLNNKLDVDLNVVSNAIKRNYINCLAYVKTLYEEEMDCIFTEREWRSFNDFKFENDDVAMIILPKEDGIFEKGINELNVPKMIPIVAWEDVIY
jgi:hypothetical protein